MKPKSDLTTDETLDAYRAYVRTVMAGYNCPHLRATGPCSCSVKDKLRCPEPILRACEYQACLEDEV